MSNISHNDAVTRPHPSSDDDTNTDDPMASQLIEETRFEKAAPYPKGIKWGSAKTGGIDVPHATRRLAWKFMKYDILSAKKKRLPINTYDISLAFKVMFKSTLVYCDRAWYEYACPHWVVLNDELGLKHIPELILGKYIRGSFYKNAMKPMFDYLKGMDEADIKEQYGFDNSVVEYKKNLFKSADLRKFFRDLPSLLRNTEAPTARRLDQARKRPVLAPTPSHAQAHASSLLQAPSPKRPCAHPASTSASISFPK
jgi:hypothetical protein